MFLAFIALLFILIMWLNLKLLKKIIRYSFKIIDGDLHISRFWIIDGHLIFKLNEISKIEFIYKFNSPYLAIIRTDNDFKTRINEKSYKSLKLISEKHNIKTQTLIDNKIINN